MFKMIKDLPLDLNYLNSSDLYSVASSLLYALKDTPKYSIISELFYLLDYDNFIKLIKYYGGKEIRIPSSQEIAELLKVLLVYQYYEVEGEDWKTSLKKAGYNEDQTNQVRAKLSHLNNILKEQKLGGRDYQ